MKSLHLISMFSTAFVVSACTSEYTRNTFPETYSDHYYWAGRQYIEIGEPEKAPHAFKMAAENGDYRSMAFLGNLYYNGTGIKADPGKALKWYIKAAQAPDDSQAALLKRIGDLYANGTGTDVNLKQANSYWKDAFDYYSSLADLSSNEAQILGLMYAEGHGVKQDAAKGISILESHFKPGEANIARALGDVYFEGKGIKVDPDKAFKWYNIAHNAGDTARTRRLADLYSSSEFYDAEKARTLYKAHLDRLEDRLAEEGDNVNPVYVRELANMYAQGQGTEENGERGIELLTRISETENGLSARIIGDIYYDGRGIERPLPGKAAEWYEKAVALGDQSRSVRLAEMYEAGNGVEKDENKATQYWQIAIRNLENMGEERSPSETRRLASIYANGNGVSADGERALDLLKSSVGRGDGLNERMIGDLYFDGTGLNSSDMAKAVEWYERAVSEGDKVRLIRLGQMFKDGNGVNQDVNKANSYWSQAVQHYDSLGQARVSWESKTLARLYANGQGVKVNQEKAFDLYMSAKEKGDVSAGRLAGDIAYAKQDMATARDLYETATKAGDTSRVLRLATMYKDGVGGPVDTQRATELFKEYETLLTSDVSRGEHEPYSSLRLGRLYLSGNLGTVDVTQGMNLLKNVSNVSAAAAIELGDLYYQGDKVDQNFNLALNWYTKSMALGEIGRIARIAYMYENGQGVPVDTQKAKSLRSRIN